MPRRGRGGRREGQPGTAYGQRTDLQTAKLPIAAGPSQQYGQRVQQEDAQRALPLGRAPQVSGPPGERTAPPDVRVPPGGLGDILRPTDRPDEPLTAGVPFGAGPGPEALNLPPTLAENDVQHLRGYMPVLEFLASRPDASPSMRAYYRGLRAKMPRT